MSSGDLLADRRFSFGEALTDQGDHAAAADLFEQVLERAPNWVPAWLALGLARERLGKDAEARQALDRAAALDTAGTFGAALHQARVAGIAVRSMPAAFVRELFDGYADRFDTHLHALHYRGPALIADALERSGAGCFGSALDLGCGTGLMARRLQTRVKAIDGVDLSPRMVEKARQTGLYRTLTVGEIEHAVGEAESGSFDLVVAADVFVYLGQLEQVCREARRLLNSSGWLAFTVQAQSGQGNFTLGDDMRFSHDRAYVEAVLAATGLDIAVLDTVSTRHDRGQPVPGLVVVARAP